MLSSHLANALPSDKGPSQGSTLQLRRCSSYTQEDGAYSGFDADEFTSRSGGKPEAIKAIKVSVVLHLLLHWVPALDGNSSRGHDPAYNVRMHDLLPALVCHLPVPS